MYENYKDQVNLLINILPYVAEESCFALHGGTAINLFVTDLPRLSVDIDLTYIPIEIRATSIQNINIALSKIKFKVENSIKKADVIHKKETGKLYIQANKTEIKIEVNLTNRGTVNDPIVLSLCNKAQILYQAFIEIQVVPIGQLYGGKLCAALDRQHPRDLFDIKILMDNDGLTDNIIDGFLLCLLSSDRPIHEILYPTLLDQRDTLENKFNGMTDQPFTYDDFEHTRHKLLQSLYSKITTKDKQFLYDFESGNPDWSYHDFSMFPGIQWKQLNIQKLKKSEPDKHAKLLALLLEKIN